MLEWQSYIVAANTLWPTEPKVFIIWPFAEKAYIPLIEDTETDHLIVHFLFETFIVSYHLAWKMNISLINTQLCTCLAVPFE